MSIFKGRGVSVFKFYYKNKENKESTCEIQNAKYIAPS
jgi:hypothetical protein